MKNTALLYDKIRNIVCSIPAGNVATYGQIGKMAGLPHGARLVGYALHHTPPEQSIPWHRIINAQGRSSFPPGSALYEKQLSLLASEGVASSNNKISLQQFGWQPDLDALLWKSPT